MKVSVTREHIRKGRPQESGCCPIAQACRSMGFKDVRVASEYITLGRLYNYVLPRSARRFVQRFDRNKPVRPFNFMIKETI